ncbi:hypothetical protein HND25_26770 [Rhodococcus erythropolis]|uniref:hypothetical protein n=1 Tax=Rhodococcus erythropolis TaxID=1833 RepID=UPI0003903672|nr:hypothetical protein [Rhodococcus erythropolis]ERB51780.1 hypothetical protein N806_11350 [Rhodococcus sp. P27]MBO8149915.1 hypothetical protein [Rhodococcus erythropolis]MDO1492184.1 hypothetical protein [Rhodococcus erythropolis]
MDCRASAPRRRSPQPSDLAIADTGERLRKVGQRVGKRIVLHGMGARTPTEGVGDVHPGFLIAVLSSFIA